jgi:site-specific DNA-methyltransferase (adenine-specific)
MWWELPQSEMCSVKTECLRMRVEHIGDATLYLGDCLEILPTLGKVDAVVTDPPYGLYGAATDKNKYQSFEDMPDEVKKIVTFVLNWGGCDRFIITPGQKMMFQYKEPDAIGAFYYPAGTGSCSWGFVGWQPIFYYGKDPILADGKGRAHSCFVSTEPAEKNGHPCPKPIRTWQKLTGRATRANETVLDPFMGSGTTGVACANLGRKFIGIEIEPKYFNIACKRIDDAYKQADLFVAPPAPKQNQEAMIWR